MSNIPPSERVETIMAERPKGLRGMGSLGMAIWAEAWRGRNKEEPPTVAPKPMAAACLKKSRRLGFPLLSLWDDMTHTSLARMFHESLAATTDMAVLPGVLGCRLLQRTFQVRLGTNTLRLPGGTPIFAVSPQQFMEHPG